MSDRDKPQTFLIPDNPPEPIPEPTWCEECGFIVLDDESCACELCGEPAHREKCAEPLDRGDGTYACHGCKEPV